MTMQGDTSSSAGAVTTCDGACDAGQRPGGMTVLPGPARHWRRYGDAPLPNGKQALDEPFAAFPSWFIRIECDRCGKTQAQSRCRMLILVAILLSRPQALAVHRGTPASRR
jgi:hypothetical protein